MRNITAASALIIALMAPGLTGAITIDTVTVEADCNAWTTDVSVTVRDGAVMAYLEYTVVVVDGEGFELDRFEYGDFIDVPTSSTAVLSFGETWHSTLDAPHDMSAAFNLYDLYGDVYNVSTADVNQPVLCGTEDGDDPVEGDGDPCRYKLKTWRRNVDDWPVDSLELGGAAYGRDELADLLLMPPRGDVTLVLARQLICAKLNVANGAAGDIGDAIAAADAYLTEHPLLSRPRRHDRKPALMLARQLRLWNASGCDGVVVCVRGDLGLTASELDADKAALEEIINLGSLKSMYR